MDYTLRRTKHTHYLQRANVNLLRNPAMGMVKYELRTCQAQIKNNQIFFLDKILLVILLVTMLLLRQNTHKKTYLILISQLHIYFVYSIEEVIELLKVPTNQVCLYNLLVLFISFNKLNQT